MPPRLRLSRARGARLPFTAVDVSPPGPWGNPFVVGKDGTAAECVHLYQQLLGGFLCVTAKAPVEAQRAARQHVLANIGTLRGRSLACWCRLGAPCHAEVLRDLAAHLDEPT